MMERQAKPVRGMRTATHLGKKIATETSKKQPKPASSKTAALKMGELMHKKSSKTQAMKEKKNKTAKYR